MPLEIIRNDITKVQADAIVNAADPTLLGGAGVDGAIHAAAGPDLVAECRTLGGCERGKAKITNAYQLPAKYVIHTVGPVWVDGNHDEDQILTNCYKNSLALAKEYHLESIAFPLIATGTFRYPKDRALQTAISVIGEFLLSNDMTVYLVVFDRKAFSLSERLFSSIKQYIDDNYTHEHRLGGRNWIDEDRLEELYVKEDFLPFFMESPERVAYKRSLDEIVSQLGETFSQMLIRLIDERGLKDPDAYRKANIDRKAFNRIKNDIYAQPSKATAIAFAIALGLNVDETRDLLGKAGFALSQSKCSDLIILYFIENAWYDIFAVNQALFEYEQNML